MPLFEFACVECSHRFEELCKNDEATLPCPVCGKESKRVISLGAPVKTGAFPFKPAAVDPRPRYNPAAAVFENSITF